MRNLSPTPVPEAWTQTKYVADILVVFVGLVVAVAVVLAMNRLLIIMNAKNALKKQ